jgi:transposase
MDVQEQRVRFVVQATQKRRPFVALCAAYEISRPTGYLWLQRYREQGVAGIAERSRKAHHSPRRTGDELERQVTGLRLRYPDWGARSSRCCWRAREWICRATRFIAFSFVTIW